MADQSRALRSSGDDHRLVLAVTVHKRVLSSKCCTWELSSQVELNIFQVKHFAAATAGASSTKADL